MATSYSSWFAATNVSVSTFIVAIAGALLLGWVFFFQHDLDPREPPEVKSMIPFIGHLIGMLRWQTDYLQILSRKISSPVYTIKILGARIYVICSPELIHKTFGNAHAFSFEPFVEESSKRILDMDEDDMRRYGQTPASDGRFYKAEIHDLINASLAPGPALAEMNSRVLAREAMHFNGIKNEGMTISLYQWTRDVMTDSAAAALYGNDNPFADDPTLIDAVWDFENDLTFLMLQFFPRLTARKAFLGRERLYEAYRRYFGADLWKNGSSLVRGRVGIARKYGFSERKVADYEITVMFGAITNGIPMSFWLLSYIIADAELTKKIRDEIETVVQRKFVNGTEVVDIDVSLFRAKCPLFVAVWDETLRLTSATSSVRAVTSDTLLNNEFLLKKGGVIQMPGAITHSSPDIWGSDAAQLNPQRFFASNSASKLSREERDKKKRQNQAYFPFGGGKHYCPGRHFAFNEILGFVSMILYAFEIERKDGTKFRVIDTAPVKFGVGIRKPAGDVEIVIRRRKELDGARLGFSVGDLSAQTSLTDSK